MSTVVDFDDESFADSLRQALENMSRDVDPELSVEEMVYKYVASSITVGWVFQMLGKGFDKAPDGTSLIEVLNKSETARLEAIDDMAIQGANTYSTWDLIRRFAEGWAKFAEAVANIPICQMYHLIPSYWGLDHLVDPRVLAGAEEPDEVTGAPEEVAETEED